MSVTIEARRGHSRSYSNVIPRQRVLHDGVPAGHFELRYQIQVNSEHRTIVSRWDERFALTAEAHAGRHLEQRGTFNQLKPNSMAMMTRWIAMRGAI